VEKGMIELETTIATKPAACRIQTS